MNEILPTPSGTPRYTRTQRRLLTVSAGLGVAVLAGLAFAVTYDDLRALVVEGRAPRRFAPAYPVMFDALITVTVLALVVARNGRWWTRWPRWLLLLLLLAGGAAASVQRATKGYAALPDEALKAGTAIAPHVMLLLAVWLWMAMFKQARTALARRAGSSSEGTASDEDGPPTAEIHPEWPDQPASVPRREPEHQPAGELADDQLSPPPEDTTWPNPWVPQEAELDWALVPYDPEPVPPYEPDPAVQPYEPDLAQPYREDPVLEPAARTVEHVESAAPAPPSMLPTDVKLVGRPAPTTQPDLVIPDALKPDLQPADPVGDPPTAPAWGSAEDEYGADLPVTDRAEDPDAGEAHAVTNRPQLQPDQTTEVEWRPPSSRFRSSPTPPDG